MSYIFVLLTACSLSFFFPQFKIVGIKAFFSRLFNTVITQYKNNNAILVLIICISIVSFIFPYIIFYYLTKISLILSFIVEVFFAYQLISLPRIQNFYSSKESSNIENSRTIIQAIVYFIDNFFIPAFCIALLGVPLALLFRALSFCTKKINDSESIISLTTSVLYFIPSYLIVLSLFATSLFFSFTNSKNAYEVFMRDRKTIQPNWLSRILSSCFGLLCIQIPVSFYSNGKVVTKVIGNTSELISHEIVKSLVYLLYCSSVLIIVFMAIARVSVTLGVW